jgi:hypothetical protein
MNQAQSQLKTATDVITSAYTDQLDYYKTVFNFYESQAGDKNAILTSATSEQRKMISDKMASLEKDVARVQANSDYIQKAMTDPDTAQAYAQAGVTLQDDPQTINEKLGKYAYSKELSTLSNDMAQKGYQAIIPGQSAPAGSQVVTTTDSKGIVKKWFSKPDKALVGTGGGLSTTTQAIINNPSLFDDLTSTVRGQVLSQLQANGYDTSNLGIKGLSDTAIQSISQTQKALSDLSDLKIIIESNTDKIGPIYGLAALNPWSESRKIQADVDRIRQTVGKALEGGVLRKEDEEKYKKILATLTDTPDTAIYKIDALISSITRDIDNYKSLQQSSGRSFDVNAPLGKKGTSKPLTAEEAQKIYKY